MDLQLLFLCLLTFTIHLIGTLAFSVHIAGVRTRKIAVSFALFSILVLLSRTSNMLLGPFMAKRIETHLSHADSLLGDFRWLLLMATLSTITGALLTPTSQRIFSRAVLHFQIHRSVPKLILHGFFKGGLAYVRVSARLPVAQNMSASKGHGVSAGMTAMNIVATSLWTVGVFAALYASVLDPSVRVTSSTLSSIINGAATIMLTVFIDPHMSGLTDDVIEGKAGESQFRKAVIWLIGSRVIGTLLAQAILLPASYLIMHVARAI